jgi:sortase A
MSPDQATLVVVVDDDLDPPAEAGPVAPPHQPQPAASTPTRPARPGLRLTRPEMIAVLGRGLTTLGILVLAFGVFVVGLTWSSARRDQRDLVRRFRQEAANALAPIGGPIKEGSPVAILDVPRLHQHLAVVEGTASSDLSRGPGHLRASPLPGQRGNVVIAGRRLAYGGPFLHLDRMRVGDRLTALTGQGVATYVVASAPRRVGAGRADVLGASADNRITLVTSDPVLLSSQRLVVVARLQSPPQGSPDGRVTDVRSDEDGLRGQSSAALPLLVWAELLLAAVIGAGWLKRRWPAANVWLLTAPVVTALLWLVFANLTRLLPATL